MRILIDLQSCQSSSRNAGIGRYSMQLAKAMALAALAREHEVSLLLSSLMPGSIADIHHAFFDLVPANRIHVFDAPAAIPHHGAKKARVRASEVIREDFLQSLRPDFVHITSLFEFAEEAITSVGKHYPGAQTAVTLYDLIPYVSSARHLTTEHNRHFYSGKIENIKKAGLLLAISEHSRWEGIDLLGLDPEDVVNISSAADESFRPVFMDKKTSDSLRKRYGITRKFIMYTASFDARKNQTGLVSAFALLPTHLRKEYQLVFVGNGSADAVLKLRQHAEGLGFDRDEVLILGHVTDQNLVALYSLCHLFVLPSLSEGFGLPALEAMSCGTATIGSNLTSIPEVIGWSDAMFDPTNPASIAEKIHLALTDEGFLRALRERGLEQAKKFSWKASAERALDAFEARHERISSDKAVSLRTGIRSQHKQDRAFRATDAIEEAVRKIVQIEGAQTLGDNELLEIAVAMAANRINAENLTLDLNAEVAARSDDHRFCKVPTRISVSSNSRDE
jgi:glycosyltransferase involved in cell wall biosynthesis